MPPMRMYHVIVTKFSLIVYQERKDVERYFKGTGRPIRSARENVYRPM
jgi:hypothetical protein